MGFFNDLGNAKKSEGGSYFGVGQFIVRIHGVKFDKTRKNDQFFAAECEVLESSRDADGKFIHNPGEMRSFFVKIVPDTPAMGNVRDFVEKALTSKLGQPFDLGVMAKEEGGQAVEDLMTTIYGKDQLLAGVILKLSTTQIETKQKRPFTKHVWLVPEASEVAKFSAPQAA